MATAGAMLDEGFMAEAGAKTMQQEREEVSTALQYAASFHCLFEEWKYCEELRPKPMKKVCFEKKSEKTMHRTEWCAEANEYRCMRCGRGSKYLKMCRTKILVKILGKWGRRHPGGHDLVRRIHRQGEAPTRRRKRPGYAR